MNFKEWIQSLEPNKRATPEDDLANIVVLIVIMGLVCMLVFG